MAEEIDALSRGATAQDGDAVRRTVPLMARMGVQLLKPKDHQAFQRNTVILFQEELRDPHAQEYGRNGQNQGGIDVLGRRNCDPNYLVGVQCRLISKPIQKAKIERDARAALKLGLNLKELIFATTADDDTHATNSAHEVEQALRAEGHDLRIVVYGWGQLQTLIARHDIAYAAFNPAVVAKSAPLSVTDETGTDAFAALVAQKVVDLQSSVQTSVLDPGAGSDASEDPALHARIDTYRDLFRHDDDPAVAERGLRNLLLKEDFQGKPWALYRVKTNLASALLNLGRDAEGAKWFEEAFELRPTDANAISNLALARIIQHEYDEAIELALKALRTEPRCDAAVGYLLQAAARSEWQGDPEDLIPDDLKGTASADIGLAEFLRRRSEAGWAERVLAIAERHLDVDEFKPIRAAAVLALAIASGTGLPGSSGPVSADLLSRVTNDLKALAEHALSIGYADRHDLIAYLNNAAMLLRLSDRHAEVETLLLGAPITFEEAELRRLLALAQLNQDHEPDALRTLAGDPDPENRLLRAQVLASLSEFATALTEALAVDVTGSDPRLSDLKWRLVAELSLSLSDWDQAAAAIKRLRASDFDRVSSDLLELRLEVARGRVAEADARERLKQQAASPPAGLDMTSRYFLAEAVFNADLPEEASRLLEGNVDLARLGPTTSLYLRALAEARRDEAFERAIAETSAAVRNDVGTRWIIASHAWNRGDLKSAFAEVTAILDHQPNHARARLLAVEILVRENRSTELFEALEERIEELDWKSPKDLYRIAALLGHFGFEERAAALAYRLFLEHRDQSRAWMTLSTLVLEEGRGANPSPGLWHCERAGLNAAVNLTYDGGEPKFFVVEPDPKLRRLDAESWEPEHPLVRAVTGLAEGQRFTAPDGREGVVENVRHKYVARLHYVLEHHEARFPEIFGFRRISIDPTAPDGLRELLDQAKARREWVQEEQDKYSQGIMPISVFAQRIGVDSIEVAAGLAEAGAKLKVCVGVEEERAQARDALSRNAAKRCVIDLLTFWNAWRVKALETVRSQAGPIHAPQTLLDRLHARRDRFARSVREGIRSGAYGDDGKLVIREISRDTVQEYLEDVEEAIRWVQANVAIAPITASEGLPPEMRDVLRTGATDVFDSLVLAIQSDSLLVSDDLDTRQMCQALQGSATWLHSILTHAMEKEQLDAAEFVRMTAQLIEAGQDHLGITGHALAEAARLDVASQGRLGWHFNMLSSVIGGKRADPDSHVNACLACIQELWGGSFDIHARERFTGHLLRRLITERPSDYQVLLKAVFLRSPNHPHFRTYLVGWMKGHFLA